MSLIKLQLLIVFSAGLSFISYSQSNNCASLTPEQSKFGYKRLSDRCEGFYNPSLSGNLQVVSFITGGDVKFDWNEKAVLTIVRIDGLQYPLNIRASSLQDNVFYQMDAFLEKNKSMEWPVGPYIYPRNIRPQQLGLYGWSGEEYDKVFSPISVFEKGGTGPVRKEVVLKIRTVLDLTNIRWNFNRASGNMCESPLGTFQVFDGNMNAGSIIEIKVPAFPGDVRSLCQEIQYRPENKRWQSELLKIRM